MKRKIWFHILFVLATAFIGTFLSTAPIRAHSNAPTLPQITGQPITQTVGTDILISNHPFYNSYEDEKTQLLYLGSEIRYDGIIRRLAFNFKQVSPPGYQVLNNFTIRLAQTSLNEFSTSYADMSNATIVYGGVGHNQLMPSAIGWNWFDITDYTFDSSKNLIVEISWGDNNGIKTGINYQLYASSSMYNRTIFGFHDSLTNPPATTRSTTRPNILLDMNVPLSPNYNASSKTFTPLGDHYQNDTLTYAVVIYNSGLTAGLASLHDPIPTGAAYIPNSAAVIGGGSLIADSNAVNWTGAIAADQKITITYQASLTADHGWVTNTAIITDPTTTHPVTISAGNAMVGPAFAGTQRVSSTDLVSGQLITYTIYITNTGLLNSTQAQLVDTFPPGWTINSATLSPSGRGTVAVDGNSVTWNTTAGAPLNNGQAVALVIVAATPQGLICPESFTNTVTVSDPYALYPATFTAPAVTIYSALNLSQGFDISSIPTGWSTIEGVGARIWEFSTNPTHSGARAISHQTASQAEDDWLYTTNATTLGNSPELRFWEYSQYPGNHYRHSVWVCAGTSCAAPPTGYVKLAELNNPGLNWHQRIFDLGLYANTAIRLAFRYESLATGTSNGGDIWFLDDVQINDSCPHFYVAPVNTPLCPGSSKTFTTTVVNNTPNIDTLFIGSNSPNFQITPDALPNLNPGQSGVITITAAVPWTAPHGTSETPDIFIGGEITATFTHNLTATANLATGWTDLPVAPRPIRSHGLVYSNNALYQIGGISSTSAINGIYRYDLTTGLWTTLTTLLTATSRMDPIALNGKIYVAGGYNTTAAEINNLQIFSTTANSWSTGAALPVKLSHYSAVAYNGEIYLIGGYNGNTYAVTNTLYIYNPISNSWRTAAPMNTIRANAAAGLIDGKIYVAGGAPSILSGTVAAVSGEVYNPVANSWSSIATLPYSLTQAADAVLEDRYLIVAGGAPHHDSHTLGRQYKSVLVYDAVLDRWTRMPDMTVDRAGIEGDTDGLAFYVSDGLNGSTYLSSFSKLTFCPNCQINFTYNDEENIVQEVDRVYVTGSFNNWSYTQTVLAGNFITHQFYRTLVVSRTKVESPTLDYRYIISNATFTTPQTAWANTNNRTLTLRSYTPQNDYRHVVATTYLLNTPATQVVNLGAAASASGQIFITTVTNGSGAGRGLKADVGYGTGADPVVWSWTPLTYQTEIGNNDQWNGTFTPTASGTFSYAVRFDPNWGPNNPNHGWLYTDRDGSTFTLAQANALTVNPPDIAVIPAAGLNQTLSPGQSATPTLTIGNSGLGRLTWSLEKQFNTGWLIPQLTSGTTAGGLQTVINVQFNTTGLNTGIYTNTLIITSDDPDENPWNVPVTLTVIAPDIAVSPLYYTYNLAPNTLSTQTLTISNTGLAALTWTLAELPPVTWLNASNTGGTVNSNNQTTSNIAFNTTGLTPGTYNTLLRITSNDPDENPLDVPVNLNLQAPILQAPATVNIAGSTGQPLPTQQLTLENTGNLPLNWTAAENPDVAWLTLNPAGGTIDADSTTNVGLTFNTTGLSSGTYSTTLNLTSNDPYTPTRNIVVVLSLSDCPPPFALNFTWTPTYPTPGAAVNFSSTYQTTGTTTLNWNLGNGQNSTLAAPTTTYTQTGAYTVTFTVVNPCGQTSINKTLTVGRAPTASFATNSPVISPTTTIVFTDTGSGAASWLWQFGDGVTSTLQNPSHTYPVPTNSVDTYPVTLTVSNDYGSAQTSQQVQIYRQAVPPDFSTSTKQAAVASVAPGALITYTITLSNTGTAAAVITYTDTLPVGLTWISGPLTGTHSISAGRGLPIQIVARAGSNLSTTVRLTNTVLIQGEQISLTRQAGIDIIPTTITYHFYLPIVIRNLR